VKDRVVESSPGSLDAARTATSISNIQWRLDALGVVCTPGMGLANAILTASTPNGGGKTRVLLAEGTWDFVSGLTIDQDNVELIALSPANTFFRARTAGALPMLTVTGDYFRIQGVTFVDQSLGTSPALYIRGNYATVDDCISLEGRGISIAPVGSGRCDGVVVRDCLFGTASTGSIDITGTCNLCQFEGNRFLATGSINVNSALVTNTVIVGNSLVSPGTINYPFGYGTVDVGNTPSGGPLSGTFTLANNQVAQADVGATAVWNVSKTYGVTLEYSLYRGNTPDIETGLLHLAMNSAECTVTPSKGTTSSSPGVTFYGAVSAGFAYLQYTTTATGFAATLRLSVVQERNY